jgi:hypothetical protein
MPVALVFKVFKKDAGKLVKIAENSYLEIGNGLWPKVLKTY